MQTSDIIAKLQECGIITTEEIVAEYLANGWQVETNDQVFLLAQAIAEQSSAALAVRQESKPVKSNRGKLAKGKVAPNHGVQHVAAAVDQEYRGMLEEIRDGRDAFVDKSARELYNLIAETPILIDERLNELAGGHSLRVANFRSRGKEISRAIFG